jgi:hypothetical protein
VGPDLRSAGSRGLWPREPRVLRQLSTPYSRISREPKKFRCQPPTYESQLCRSESRTSKRKYSPLGHIVFVSTHIIYRVQSAQKHIKNWAALHNPFQINRAKTQRHKTPGIFKSSANRNTIPVPSTDPRFSYETFYPAVDRVEPPLKSSRVSGCDRPMLPPAMHMSMGDNLSHPSGRYY